MNYIEEIFSQADDQKSSLWELEVDGNTKLKFRVETVNVPFVKFSTEALPTGEKYFNEVEHPGEFSVTIREDNEMSVRKFFKTWEEAFYKDGQFISQGNISIGSASDNIHKTMTLRLLKQEIKDLKQTALIKEIKDNFLSAFARQKAGGIANLGSEYVPDSVNRKRQEILEKTFPKKERATKKAFAQVGKQVVSAYEVPVRTFKFNHVKLLGFDAIEFNYSDGEPLKYSISLTCDFIDEY